MNDEWTTADQDRAVELRKQLVADLQTSKRGNRWDAWLLDKLVNLMLWVEREGRRLLHGWRD